MAPSTVVSLGDTAKKGMKILKALITLKNWFILFSVEKQGTCEWYFRMLSIQCTDMDVQIYIYQVWVITYK